MFVDVGASAGSVAADCAQMIPDFQVDALDVLAEGAGAEAFVVADVAGKVADLQVDATHVTKQVAPLPRCVATLDALLTLDKL